MAKPKAGFDGKELLAGIESTLRGGDGKGLSVDEICEQMHHNPNWVRKRLTQLKAQRRLIVGQRVREAIDGRRIFTPIYSVKK